MGSEDVDLPKMVAEIDDVITTRFTPASRAP